MSNRKYKKLLGKLRASRDNELRSIAATKCETNEDALRRWERFHMTTLQWAILWGVSPETEVSLHGI